LGIFFEKSNHYELEVIRLGWKDKGVKDINTFKFSIYKLRDINYRLIVSNYIVRGYNYTLLTAYYTLKDYNYKLRGINYRLITSNYNVRVYNYIL